MFANIIMYQDKKPKIDKPLKTAFADSNNRISFTLQILFNFINEKECKNFKNSKIKIVMRHFNDEGCYASVLTTKTLEKEYDDTFGYRLMNICTGFNFENYPLVEMGDYSISVHILEEEKEEVTEKNCVGIYNFKVIKDIFNL